MKAIVLKIIISALLFGAISTNGQNRSNIRNQVAAGSFYASSAGDLRKQLDQLFNSVTDQSPEKYVNAIIVPDGKYETSGQIAAAAYSKINTEQDFIRIFIIGTSNNKDFEGVSVFNKGDYRTPLGVVKVDNEVVDRLILNNRLIKYRAKAHENEYSIEVQLPFLQYRLNKPFKIVPVILGTQSTETCKELAEILEPYFTNDNLFILSGDISQPAHSNKNLTKTITEVSPDNLTEMMSLKASGKQKQMVSYSNLSSIYTILNLIADKKNFQTEEVKNIDTENNQPSNAFIIKNTAEPTSAAINLTQEEMQFLLRLVRETITKKLDDNSIPGVNENELSENLKSKYGAFVTLTVNDETRGFMGKFATKDPLYKVVQEMAVASAFQDYRYLPVSKNEIRDIDIEISVITPLKQVFSSDEIKLGKHGIHMAMYGRSGTFLPQVAKTTGWSKEEFLGFCSREKAGLGWEGWKTADLFTFEAFVFSRRDALRRE